MLYDMHEIAEMIPHQEARMKLHAHIAFQDNTIHMLTGERDYLRGQVSLALRSMKFDLYPELPLVGR